MILIWKGEWENIKFWYDFDMTMYDFDKKMYDFHMKMHNFEMQNICFLFENWKCIILNMEINYFDMKYKISIMNLIRHV